MSLMGTLAKVAIGVAVAKGASSMMKKSGGSAKGDGGLFGDTYSPKREPEPRRDNRQKEPNLQDMLGDLLGGKQPTGRDTGGASGGGGGLGDLLESLAGGAAKGDAPPRGGLDELLRGGGGGQQTGGAAGGGLGGLIEALTGGGKRGSSGGLGDLVKDLSATSSRVGKKDNSGSFGDVLNQSFQRRGEHELTPTPEQDAAAGLMLRAMIQAAKSDGKIDRDERAKLLDNLGDISAAERRFVNDEMEAPVDVRSLARQVPSGLENQVYAMSVMAIDLDSQNEAEYLHKLATEMGMEKRHVNRIHEKMGVPVLYR